MLDPYENSLHALVAELVDSGHRSGLFAVIGDMTDSARMDEIPVRYQPQIVFDTTAQKHAPLMEASPCEAIKNNVRGNAPPGGSRRASQRRHVHHDLR